MDKNKLLQSLNQEIALASNVGQVAVDVQLANGQHLPEHGIYHNVGARTSDAGAARINQSVEAFSIRSSCAKINDFLPAVDDKWSIRVSIGLRGLLDEGQ